MVLSAFLFLFSCSWQLLVSSSSHHSHVTHLLSSDSSLICKQVWTKPYYLAVTVLNMQISWNVKRHVLFQIRWVSWQRSPCSILKVIGSQLATHNIQVVDNFGIDLPLMFKVHKIWSVDTREKSWNCCHQMSDFKAKMHHIRRPLFVFLGGFNPLKLWVVIQTPKRHILGWGWRRVI